MKKQTTETQRHNEVKCNTEFSVHG